MCSLAYLCRSLLVLCLLAVMAGPVSAQEMPAWAAPQQIPESGPSDGARVGPTMGPFQCPRANPNCEDITPAPVDGGLALLALLGTGYAVRRLRRDADHDSDGS